MKESRMPLLRAIAAQLRASGFHLESAVLGVEHQLQDHHKTGGALAEAFVQGQISA